MLVVIKRRYKKQHVIGGAGIFDTITGVVKRLFTSGVANRVASTALNMSKDAARELGKKALEVGKNTAVEAGKRLVDKAAAKLLASTIPLPHAVENQKVEPLKLTPENAAILARLIDNGAETNISNLLSGYGLGKPSSNAVSIRDLVRHLNSNGAGLKLAR